MKVFAPCLATVACALLIGTALFITPAGAGIVAAPGSALPDSRLEGLGSLQDDLMVWLDMNSTERGGVGWSRSPVKVVATSEVTVQEETSRRWLDFSAGGALLKFEPALQLGTSYTLTTWMSLPAPHGHGLIWQGAKGSGSPLFFSANGLFGWKDAGHEQITYTPLPKGFAGWHHAAVACDGSTTTVYLDGNKVDSVTEVLTTNILSIGNHWMRAHQHWMMAAGLDDQFIFRRALTEKEVQAVMKFGR